MRKLVQSLVLAATVAHVGLSIEDAYARGGARGNSASSFNSYRPTGSQIGIVVSNPNAPPRLGDGQGYRPPPRHFHPGDNADEAFHAQSGECAGGLQLTEIDASVDPIDGLAKISGETQRYIDRCGCNAQGCIADALDRYAEALTQVAPSLPPALRNLPQIVASAAHRARTAPTTQAAAHLLRAAVVAIHAAVHKTISLIRAADSDASSVATRGADLVASTLTAAASSLERADSL